MADIRGVLDRGLGVLVPLDDHAFGLVVVEEQVVLERAGLVRCHERVGLLGQPQILVALALDELETCDAEQLTHGPDLQDLTTMAFPSGMGRSLDSTNLCVKCQHSWRLIDTINGCSTLSA